MTMAHSRAAAEPIGLAMVAQHEEGRELQRTLNANGTMLRTRMMSSMHRFSSSKPQSTSASNKPLVRLTCAKARASRVGSPRPQVGV